jgi:tight adherence protein C
VVDLLALCVGAGADFMTAMSRIVREFRPCPVRDELAIVLSEIRVGKRRRDALRAFAARVQTPESSTFARTLIQADRMGTGLIDALTVLSEDMRIARYHWAERFAQKAPLKMLVPLVLSLGSAMVIVAGPIIIQFMRGGVMGLAGEEADINAVSENMANQ